MRCGPAICGVCAAVWPFQLLAHDAFGDLGPLYSALLHPLVDPVQGLLVVGAAVFLARQPLQVVRMAYPTFVLATLAAVLLATFVTTSGLTSRALAVLIAIAGLLAATGFRPGQMPAAALVGAIGVAVGAMIDPTRGLHNGTLTVVGGAGGLALATLLVWGVVDLAERKISPVAGAIIGGWVAAVGLMLAAVPA